MIAGSSNLRYMLLDLVITLAGGYARRVEDTVQIHVNTIAAAREIADEGSSAGHSVE